MQRPWLDLVKFAVADLRPYATPLSSPISHSTVKHHFYADDTQLFISFSAPNFSTNMLFFETLSPKYLPGCLPICYNLSNQKLNFCQLVSQNSPLKLLTLSFKCFMNCLSLLHAVAALDWVGQIFYWGRPSGHDI